MYVHPHIDNALNNGKRSIIHNNLYDLNRDKILRRREKNKWETFVTNPAKTRTKDKMFCRQIASGF